MNNREEQERFVLENYEIYEDGRIYSPFKNKVLNCSKGRDGYFRVSLKCNDRGDRNNFRVGRLVALKYLEKPENYNIVNHKDLNKENDHKNNLEWSTIALNTQHAYDYSAFEHIRNVKSIEEDGTIHIFPSVSHASRYYSYKNPTVVQAMLEGRVNNPISRGRRTGLYFEYTNESVTTIERVAITVDSE